MSQSVKPWRPPGKSNIVSDDIAFFDEPMFQDGVISQVDRYGRVVRRDLLQLRRQRVQRRLPLDVPRRQHDSGTEHRHRHVHEFQPRRGSKRPNCRITTRQQQRRDHLSRYDQPFETQQPAGSTGAGHLECRHLRPRARRETWWSGRRRTTTTSTITGALAGRRPAQCRQLPGGDPGRLGPEPPDTSSSSKSQRKERSNLTVSQQYGSAGGTYYPTFSFGHHTAAAHDRSRGHAPGGPTARTWARPRWPASLPGSLRPRALTSSTPTANGHELAGGSC